MSPAALATIVFAAANVAVLALTIALALLMMDVSVLAAVGFGLYCTFWLGIGFGIIFASAAVFGRDH